MAISPIGVANEIQSVLSQLRAKLAIPTGRLDAASSSANLPALGLDPSSSVGLETQGFAAVMKNALQQIDASQKASSELGKRFVKGDSQVALSDVMIASQKSNINLQTAVQVRNRFVSAYQSIMNMQI
jgi:flagellar hook-basal body complex protein FliE